MSILLSLALLAADPTKPAGATITTQGPNGSTSTMNAEPVAADRRVDQAVDAIKAGKPADALPLLDAVIADFEKANPPDPKVMKFSARTMTQSLMYAMIPATQKKNGVVVDGNWATAYFLKGFALIDLNRPDEALPNFDRAIALSPMDSQFLGERGEWYKSHKQWDKAYADFESAHDFAGLSDDDAKVGNDGRALRGMGFVLIEQGKLKEAKKMFKDALKLNPNDQGAKHELAYIESLN